MCVCAAFCLCEILSKVPKPYSETNNTLTVFVIYTKKIDYFVL